MRNGGGTKNKVQVSTLEQCSSLVRDNGSMLSLEKIEQSLKETKLLSS